MTGNLRIDTIFSLPSLISIFENARDDDRKRFLMADLSYTLVTVSGVLKAFSTFAVTMYFVLLPCMTIRL